MCIRDSINDEIRGTPGARSVYGAPTVVLVLYPTGRPSGVQDLSLIHL